MTLRTMAIATALTLASAAQAQDTSAASATSASPSASPAPSSASTQSPPLPDFTVEDLIPGGETFYRHSYPQNVYTAWWGERLVRLGIDRCEEVDLETGALSTLFTLEDIRRSLPGGMSVSHFYAATFPYPGEPLVLVSTPRRRALVDFRELRTVWQQERDAEALAEDWCPASRALALVTAGHDLAVRTPDGQLRRVTTDGSHDIRNGESVHRDEFGITKGTFWSPDGRHLAFYRMDQTAVTDYPQVDIAPDTTGGQSRCARAVPDKYPMAGEATHSVRVGVYHLDAGTLTWLATSDSDCYLTNIAFDPDSRTLTLIHLDRDQRHAALRRYDAQDGHLVATLVEEHDARYVEPLASVRHLPWDKTKFVMLSRRDGYNHLYLHDSATGRQLRQLTRGEWEVVTLDALCEKTRAILLTAADGTRGPLTLTARSVDTRGRVTPLGPQRGWHALSASPSGRYAVDNWSDGADTIHGRHLTLLDVTRPSLARHDCGGSALSLRSTLAVADPWTLRRQPVVRTGTIKSLDGTTDLHYRLTLPPDLDPQAKHPAIIYVYGGPHAHLVDASRHYGLDSFSAWMATRGYVLLSLDGRGSEHRGRAFEQATFRHLGDTETDDQMAGAALLRSLPYVDARRIGVYGWSFGGFMSATLATRHADTFPVAVAGGPVIDWRYYEVMYGERYMDTPQANPEGYDRASLLNHAGDLAGRLLVIIGGNDPTCVPQHTLSFLRACIDRGRHPDLFVYPSDAHNMAGRDRVHLARHIARYFDDHLK